MNTEDGADGGFAAALVTAMGDLGYGLVVATPEGDVLSVNDAWCEITGVSELDAKARAFGAALDPEELAGAAARQHQRLTDDDGQAPPYESAIIHADGRRIPIETGVRVVRIGDHQLLLAFIRDITVRKEQEELVHLFRALVDEMPIAVAVWAEGDDVDDPGDLRLVATNSAGASSLGGRPAELLGSRLRDVVPELLTTDLPQRYLDVIRTGRPHSAGDVVVRTAAGDRAFDAKLFALPGRFVGTTYEDVTERHRADRDRRVLLRRLAATEAATLRRVALDLHDQPVQYLTAVNLRLGRLKADVRGTAPEAEVAALEGLVGAGIDQLRRIFLALRPPSLDEGHLSAAVSEYARDVLGPTAPAVEVVVEDVSAVDSGVVMVAFRILQEAMTNAHRHASATTVTVAGGVRDGRLWLEVTDDGVGFDPHQGIEPGHLGLASMRERAQALGGTVDVHRGERGGTVVTAELPINDPGGA